MASSDDRATAEAPAKGRPLRLCLAASGGGHVRQLLDLQPVWSKHDYFFVTEETALGQTLQGEHRTYFVPHYAWGQVKFGTPFKMISRAIASFFQTAAFMLRERPDFVISSGAGAVFFAVLWGRLLGAKIVIIESFARFEKPSLFGRIAAPFAHDMVIQSAKLAGTYPKARIHDPLKYPQSEPPPKQPLLFATVGATLPFDRLVDSVAQLHAEGAIPERIVIQTGIGGHAPEGLEVRETLPFDEVQALLRDASIVICHGGTGSLITALRQGCHVIALPRLFALGEHYDDHQLEITEAFEVRGLVKVARSVDELRDALAAVRDQPRVLATTDPRELISFLEERIAGHPRGPKPAAATVPA
jgi:UDP-N-acetylglucosamine--N-acetylmuramyl-(pentapeptide) pyrophosphoryl-undecaprenol N-acetylglucosamine transferase